MEILPFAICIALYFSKIILLKCNCISFSQRLSCLIITIKFFHTNYMHCILYSFLINRIFRYRFNKWLFQNGKCLLKRIADTLITYLLRCLIGFNDRISNLEKKYRKHAAAKHYRINMCDAVCWVKFISESKIIT